MKRPGPRLVHKFMVRLTEPQVVALEAEVARSGIPAAEVARRAIDLYLASTPPPAPIVAKPAMMAPLVVGSSGKVPRKRAENGGKGNG